MKGSHAERRLYPFPNKGGNATLHPIEAGNQMQTKIDAIELEQPRRAPDDAPKARFCLRCKASFWSAGFGQRICAQCKSSSALRTAMPEGIGQGRRHSSGRSH
jgi:hypothetical protein